MDIISTLAIRAVDVSLCLLVLVLGLLCSTIVSKTGTSHSSLVFARLRPGYGVASPGYVLVTECLCQVTSWLRSVFARLRPGYGVSLPGYVLVTEWQFGVQCGHQATTDVLAFEFGVFCLNFKSCPSLSFLVTKMSYVGF